MDNNQVTVDPKKYLVTEKSDITNFSQEKIVNDLDAIKKAELRSKTRSNILAGSKENAASRAMNALSLINPFKGV
ncbi:MAG: hypothetical protein PHP08_01290 [Candidatus Dojkabacteria bacterium]|nr:hypothetical protein [Candidatus Dojkabacteria bacterium]